MEYPNKISPKPNIEGQKIPRRQQMAKSKLVKWHLVSMGTALSTQMTPLGMWRESKK